jgi:hypothetical protein
MTRILLRVFALALPFIILGYVALGSVMTVAVAMQNHMPAQEAKR